MFLLSFLLFAFPCSRTGNTNRFNRRNAIEPLVTCMVLLILGSLMYALSVDEYMVLASRFVVGCSFSTVAVSLAYTALATTEIERYHYMSVNSAAQALGCARSFLGRNSAEKRGADVFWAPGS